MNPFEESQALTVRPQGNTNALVDVESQRALAEVQSAIILAKKFPRNQKEAFDRIMNSCQRVGLANEAVYTYARGGSSISGPSIRLAEAIAQCWGNLSFGIQELDQRNGESTVKAFCWDMESNTKQEKVFQVPHTRYTKQGTTQLKDPRDIYEAVANQGARRLRACILGVIPGDVIDAAVEECEKTQKAKADVSPEAVNKLVTAFAAFGVSKEQIEARIQRRIDAIQPGQIIGMRKIYNSLKDGMSKPEDYFEAVAQQEEAPVNKGANGLKEKLQNKAASPPAKLADEIPMTKEETAEVSPPSQLASNALLQEVYALITKLGQERGDSPDDVIDALTKGKVSCLIDLETKAEAYLYDIKLIVEKELSKPVA